MAACVCGCGGHGQRCLLAITNRKRRDDVGVCGDEHLTWRSPFENKTKNCSEMLPNERRQRRLPKSVIYMFNTVLSVDDHCASNARFRLGIRTLFSEPVASHTSHAPSTTAEVASKIP